MTTVEAPVKLLPLTRRPAVLRLLVVALLAEIGFAVVNISTMPVYLANERHFGESAIGLVLTAFLLSEAAFKSPMGHLAERFGRKNLMVVGPALCAMTPLLSLAVPHNLGANETLLFVALRIVDGLGAAMIWPATFAAMADLVEEGEQQQAMSLLNVCYLLGIALALPIGGIVNDLTGRTWSSLVLASFLFAGVAVTVARSMRPDGKAHRPPPPEHSTIELAQLAETAREIPAYVALAVVIFVGIGFPMAIIKLFAQQQFGMSESAFGALVFPAAIAMAVLSVPMSRYGERLGRVRAVHLGLGLCSGGLTLIALGAFFKGLQTPWALALGAIPVGIGFLLAIPAWMTSVSEINPHRRAANLGVVMTAQGVGAIIGAPLGALLYEKLQVFGTDFGRYSPFVGCAVFVVAGWVLSLRILGEAPSPTPER